MAKGGDGHNKRRKISHDRLLPSGNIRGSFELHNLLRFKQHAGPEVKAGIDEFKNFCAEIAVNANSCERDIQLKVLKQYCDEQSSGRGEERDFSDLFCTWALAAQNNDDGVFGAVPVALTQFFRTISSELDFREFGLSLCQTLLKRDQLQLVERGLSAPKSKAFLAISCIKLLSEIVNFDGGAMVGVVFSRRDFIFKRFDTLLEPSSRTHDHEHQRRSIRSHALKLLLVLLKYLDAESMEEMISQARMLHACVKGLPSDSPALVGDVLTAFRRSIVDAELSRDSKKKFLNSSHLGLLAQLYDYDEAQSSHHETDASRPVRETIHEFLIYACTSRNGISIQQTGWYPREFNAERLSTTNSEAIDLGLESPYYSDDYTNSVPVKNSILAAFLQKLDTSKDTLQAELIVRIFEHVPELVADYFCKKSKPLGAPNDDAEWRGQFAFLFSIINLPVPSDCGWHGTLPSTPPPLSVVMESIVPRQLDRATLNQCLKSEDDVVVISAAKILIAIENKLGRVLGVFKDGNSDLWKQGARMLRETVAMRHPNFSEIGAAVQRADDVHVREALFQYMARSSDGSIAYDVGPAVQRTLATLGDNEPPEDVRASLTRQLASLMKLAGTAKSTKWASFVHLLAYAATHDDLKASARDHLMPKLLEKAVLHEENAFWALITALGTSGIDLTTIIQSLDNCITRVTKQPVKYFDISNGDVSLVACCLSEQWNYITDAEGSLAVGLFAADFFACLEVIGEPTAILNNLRHVFSCSPRIMERIEKWKQNAPEILISTPATASSVSIPAPKPTRRSTAAEALDLSTIFHPVQPIPASLSKLTTWSTNPDFENDLQNLQTSRLASLLRLLSSPTNEFRLSAHATLAKITHVVSLPTCTYSERASLHLLLGEVCETFHSFTLATPNTPLPTIVPSLAIFLLSAITNPADMMYSTANRFLLRSPTWTPLTRLLLHWTTVTLLREPDSDDPTAPFVGVNKWLDMLVSGLRTERDMDLYRKSGVFERVCSLYLAPSTRRETRVKILGLVNAGATVADGEGGLSSKGADTLITRVGIRAWLAVVKTREAVEKHDLGRRVAEQVERVLEASKGSEYIDAWERRRAGLGAGGAEEKDVQTSK
ncbi:hypothetical protein DV736_g5185, partial [Chaetothyriales sp. CBS 134916]